jgi:predicted kinase
MRANPPLRIACLVVLVGPPASGKSTWARRNGCGAVHVSQDGLIDAISPDGFEHVYRPVYRAAEDAVARASLQDGHTVIVDRTNRTSAHRERWLRIAREADAPAVAVEMIASAELCRVRNSRRDDRQRLTEERLERMLAVHERVAPDEGFAAIYTGETALAEILSQLSRKEGMVNEHCHPAR